MEVLLLLLMEVKRTEWGKLTSNSKPMCDLASWCSKPAINIKHGFGMGFQLGPLAPLPSVQQPHPSPSRGLGCWPGSHGSEEQDVSLLSLPSFSPLPLITLLAEWGRDKEFQNLCLSVGTRRNWNHFFPPGHKAHGGGKVPGLGVWGKPRSCMSAGGGPAKAAAGSRCAGFIPSEGCKTSLQGSSNATQNCISTEYQRLCRNVSPGHCQCRRPLLNRIQLIGKSLGSQDSRAFRRAGDRRGPWDKPLGRVTQT